MNARPAFSESRIRPWIAPSVKVLKFTPEEIARIQAADDPKAELAEVYRSHTIIADER